MGVTTTPAAAGLPQALEDGSEGGLQTVGHVRGAMQRHGGHGLRLGRGVVGRRAGPALRPRYDRLESASPETLENYSIIFATRHPAPLHLKLLT